MPIALLAIFVSCALIYLDYLFPHWPDRLERLLRRKP